MYLFFLGQWLLQRHNHLLQVPTHLLSLECKDIILYIPVGERKTEREDMIFFHKIEREDMIFLHKIERIIKSTVSKKVLICVHVSVVKLHVHGQK